MAVFIACSATSKLQCYMKKINFYLILLLLNGCSNNSVEKTVNTTLGVIILTPIALATLPFTDFDNSCQINLGAKRDDVLQKLGTESHKLGKIEGMKGGIYLYKLSGAISSLRIDQYQKNRTVSFSCSKTGRQSNIYLVFNDDILIDIFWANKEKLLDHYKVSSTPPY